MFVLYHQCDFATCTTQVVGDDGLCEWCFQIRCEKHFELPYHACMSYDVNASRARGWSAAGSMVSVTPWLIESTEQHYTLTEQWKKILAPLKSDTIAAQASSLRPGHTCEVDIPSTPRAVYDAERFNQCNGHFLVTFDDGVRWLLRVRIMTPHSPPKEMQRMITSSEIETMKALHRAGIKVPDAWAVTQDALCEYSPGVPLDYFFVEFIEGKPWSNSGVGGYGAAHTKDDVQSFNEDYAKFQISLSKVRFNAIGSLYPDPADNTRSIVGPLISHTDFNLPESPYFLGPFKTNRERYLAHIDLTLDLTAKGLLHQFHPLLTYLGHLYLRDLVCDIEELGLEETEFYARHADFKADQCMAVDNSLVGVIDWEWAYVTTKAEAFSPTWLVYGNAEQRAGSNIPTEEEEMLVSAYEKYDRADLAACVRNGRVYNRLENVVGSTPTISQLNALTRAVYGEQTTTMIHESRNAWIAAALEPYKENEIVQRLAAEDVDRVEARERQIAEAAARLASWGDLDDAMEEGAQALNLKDVPLIIAQPPCRYISSASLE